MTLKLTSSAFIEKGNIPDKYTCKGKNISPPVTWEEAPEGAKSFTLICDDPDAPGGTWDHWILLNIPSAQTHLAEGIAARSQFENGSRHGKNSWGRNDYGGPCPPSGKHRYYFKIYALDTLLDLPAGATKKEVEHSMKGHILSEGQLMGYYQK